jgi:DNA-binding NarL/FixJ family response regulator
VRQEDSNTPAGAEPRVSAPAGLEAWTLDLEGDSFVVLEYPLPRPPVSLAPLTPAEREVASLTVLGLSNADIARRRASRPRTIANQLASIFRKLGVCSRLELQACLGHAAGAPNAPRPRRR